jgi:hypothetical protein
LIRSYPSHLRACICCYATKRAGSNRRSAPMTTANRLLMTEAPVPSLYGFEGIFSAMLQISRFVVSHELDDTRP